MPEQPLHDEDLSSEQCRPVGLDLDLAAQELRITFADGAEARFPAIFLRKNCPCAECRTEREKHAKTLLPILTGVPAGEVRATGGHLVGNYAMQIEFSDNHATGIYDFRLLRTLHERRG